MGISYAAASRQCYLSITGVASMATTLLLSVEVLHRGGGTVVDRAARANHGSYDKEVESSIHHRQRRESFACCQQYTYHPLKETNFCQQHWAPDNGDDVHDHPQLPSTHREHRAPKGQKGKGDCQC